MVQKTTKSHTYTMLSREVRSTRGQRSTELEGEDAEADAEFWGHETWKESDDEEYSTEDG